MRDRAKTADEMALDIMLSKEPKHVRDAKLAKLRRLADVSIGALCPHCDATDEIQDNGRDGSQREFLCVACGHQWGPETEV